MKKQGPNLSSTSWCRWSWEENKTFELALATVDEDDPVRWEVVAASIVGGKKSAEDVQRHYVILLEDLKFIESGKLDHILADATALLSYPVLKTADN
ncbi:unnamed protein product [Ilex paraguariensis]|uniref:Myb-like domain-containing protein n=1 Tax=Ilex paraguariensis TaxID=185542 RepID=A0ABC8S6J9_9AQUA